MALRGLEWKSLWKGTKEKVLELQRPPIVKTKMTLKIDAEQRLGERRLTKESTQWVMLLLSMQRVWEGQAQSPALSVWSPTQPWVKPLSTESGAASEHHQVLKQIKERRRQAPNTKEVYHNGQCWRKLKESPFSAFLVCFYFEANCAQGTIYAAGDWNRVGQVQGKCTTPELSLSNLSHLNILSCLTLPLLNKDPLLNT